MTKLPLIGILLALPLCANEEICVAVKDPAGLPAAGALVMIEPRAAGAVLRGEAGDDGRYCTPIAPGEHVIRVSHDGLMGSAAAVSVRAGGGRVELFGMNLQKDIRRDLALRLTFRNLSDNVDPLYWFTAPFSIEASVRIRLGAGR